MATPQNYSVDLEAAASRRINPFLKGLTMLTGGLAGEFTGTNEQIRERNKARQALLQEEIAKRENERLMESMKTKRAQMLEDELKIITAREEAAARIRSNEAERVRESKRPSMVGYLKTRPDYQAGGPMAMPIPALESMDTLEESVAMEKARQDQEEEARKLKSGYINLGAIGGTPEQIREIGEKYPEYKNMIEQAIKRAGSEEPKVVSRQDPLTGKRVETIEFPRTYNPQMRKAYIESLGEEERNIFGDEPAPGAGTNQTQATKPTDIKGFTVKRIK